MTAAASLAPRPRLLIRRPRSGPLGLLVGALVVAFSILPGCTEGGGGQGDAARASSDSTTRYVPRAAVAIGKYAITGLNLQPGAAWLTLRGTADTVVWRTALCADYVASLDTLYLRCGDTPIGTVTVEGHFIGSGRRAVGLSALITVEQARRITYRQRDSFIAAHERR